jgi:hypothetical protein
VTVNVSNTTDCQITAEEVMNGACLECCSGECPIGCLYFAAVQAAELRGRLKEYEDLEVGGKLIQLPCKIGDKIYVIPSKTNYRLNVANGRTENNRIYEQIVDAIHIYLTGYALSSCEGLLHQPSALYGETWFITKEEAEKALEERKC